MKINLHIPVNFPFAALVITIIGAMFTFYIYKVADGAITQVASNGIVSTPME